MRKVTSLLMMMLIAFTMSVSGQMNAYTFSQSSLTYTPITGGTVHASEAWDDAMILSIPIGFTFTLNGNPYTAVTISPNGYLVFGSTSSLSYAPISSTTAVPGVASAVGRDLQGRVGSTIRSETIGTAGNYIYVVQWLDAKRYGTTYPDEYLNFQIRLHQNGNKIEFLYGPYSGATYPVSPVHPQVGVRGATNADFLNRETATDWAATTAGGINTAVCVINATVRPVNGLSFVYSPPVANQPPLCATIASPADGAINVYPSALLNWANGGGIPDGYKIYFGTNTPPTNIENGTNLGAVTTYDPLPNMNYSTTYYWKIVPYNTYGEATGCPVWSFTTMADPTISTFPWIETFEGDFPPLGWMLTGSFNWDKWTTVTPANSSARANFWSFNVPNFCVMTTPPINLGSLSTPGLFFKWSHTYNVSYPNDQLDIRVSGDGGNTWEVVWTKTGTDFNSNDGATNTTPGSFVEDFVDLTSFNTKGTILVQFYGISGWGPILYVDDVRVQNVAFGTLSGFVTEATRGPIENARVFSGIYEDFTDATGYYQINNILSGTYDFTCEAEGYFDEVAEDVQITPNVTTTLNFELGYAQIAVNPTSLEETLSPGETSVKYLTISNTGIAPLTWSGSVVVVSDQYQGNVVIPDVAEKYEAIYKDVSMMPAPKIESRQVNGGFELLRGSMATALQAFPTPISLVTFNTDTPGTYATTLACPPPAGTNNFWAGADYDNSGNYYAVDYVNNSFCQINLSNGTYTLIGSTTITNITDLAFDKTTNVMYAARYNGVGSDLYTINVATGVATLVGNTIASGLMISMACDGAGQLWGFNISTDQIYTINKGTGVGTVVGAAGFDGNYAQSMSWDPLSDIVYLAAYTTQGELRILNRTTGATTLVGVFPGGAEVEGIAFPTPITSWLAISPTSGTVNPGGTATVDVIFDATELTDGIYYANININHDGQVSGKGTVTVPVQLTVTAPSAPEPPFNPNPAVGATMVPLQPVFTWTNGAYATQAKIRIERIAVPFNALVHETAFFAGNSFDLASVAKTLNPKANHRWQVTCKNSQGEIAGPWWTFQSIGAGTINGTVTNAFGGAPLEGVTITASGYTATTAANGTYSIPGVIEGPYTVEASLDGFVTQSQNVNVAHGLPTTANFALSIVLDPPTNLEAEVENFVNVNLTWNAPGSISEFRYDDGVRTGQLGFGSGLIDWVLGAKHTTSATLHEMSWLLSDAPDGGGPHLTVQIYVFGLQPSGLPNGLNVLYTASVSNVDGIFNTHVFPTPITATGGFFLAVGYNGFVGLGTDDGIGEPYVYQPGSHYYSAGYTGNAWTAWDPGFPVNGMIRGYGVPGSKASYVVNEAEVQTNPAGQNAGVLELRPLDEPVYAGEPRWESKAGSSTRALLGYNIYRNGEFLIFSENTNYSDLNLPSGTYSYEVTALYDEGESEPAGPVTVQTIASIGTLSGTVTDMISKGPISGVTITAEELRYSTVTNAQGYYEMTMPTGDYTVTASKAGYVSETVEPVVILFNQTTTLNFQLEFGTPVLLTAEKQGPAVFLEWISAFDLDGKTASNTGSFNLSNEIAAKVPSRARPEYKAPSSPKQGGDDIAGAVVIPALPFTSTGTTEGYLDNYNVACPFTATGAPDVVYSFTPATDMFIDVDLCASLYDTKVYIFETDASNSIACNDDACGDEGLQSLLTAVALTGGLTYYIVVDGYNSLEYGTYYLDVVEYIPPSCVECPVGAITESELCGEDLNGGCNANPTAFAPIANGDVICGTAWADNNNRDTDWYEVVIDSPKLITWSVLAEFPVLIYILDGSNGCDALGLVASDLGASCEEAIAQAIVPPGTYYLFVGNQGFTGSPCGSANDYLAELTMEDAFLPFFTVYRNGTPLMDVYGNTYIDLAVEPGMEYCYKVTETVAEGYETGFSNELCVEFPLYGEMVVNPLSLSEVHPTPPQLTTQTIIVTNDGDGVMDFDIDVLLGEMPEGRASGLCIASLYSTGCFAFGDGLLSWSFSNVAVDIPCNDAGNWYNDFTSITHELLPGETYQLTVEAGYANTFVSLWIDFNDDLLLTPDELLANFECLTTSPTSVDVTIPASAPVGNHVLRFRTNWLSAALDPCITYSYGNAADFMASIGGSMWLAISPAMGTLAPGASMPIEVTFNSEGLEDGDYVGNLLFTSNNPFVGQPEVIVPVSLHVGGVPSQDILLPQGWSGWSSYIDPMMDASFADVIAPVVPDMIITQYFMNLFYPAYGINTMGDFSNAHGYVSKMNAEDVLTLTGMMASPTVELAAGWNLFPVLVPCNLSSADVFGQIPGLIIAKEVAGIGIYYPATGVYTLTTVVTGKAYWVKVAGATSFTFPACAKDASSSWIAPLRHSNTTNWNDVTYTGVSHIVVFDENATNSLVNGDVIGAFTSDGTCAGMTVVNGKTTSVALFGNDVTTAANDGFADGEQLSYRVYRNSNQTEYILDVTYSTQAPNFDGLYAVNGLSVIKDITMTATGLGSLDLNGLTIYPNPSTGVFNVAIDNLVKNISYQITDAKGQAITQGSLAGSQVIDLSDQPKGVYFIRFTGDNVLRVEKLVIR